jgi:hypothetical protein
VENAERDCWPSTLNKAKWACLGMEAQAEKSKLGANNLSVLVAGYPNDPGHIGPRRQSRNWLLINMGHEVEQIVFSPISDNVVDDVNSVGLVYRICLSPKRSGTGSNPVTGPSPVWCSG